MDKQKILSVGKRVLTMEANAVQQLANTLDDEFCDVVQLFANVKGRVIITGMGKSGHVGRKIAATMASVGTPAFFIHPGEASHGDLGMLTEDDAILALSNSGETKELADIVAYSRHFSIPLVCIVGKKDSTLAKSSDYVLCHPSLEDACPLGLAPTTSTTTTLALGDALAMALLDLKGFSKEQFKGYHPGGKLGAMLLKTKELMITGEQMPIVSMGTAMSNALIEMTSKSLGCVGVIDKEGILVGIITDGDLRRHMSEGLLKDLANNVMTAHPLTISGDMLAAQAVRLMNEKKITVLFVVENNKPVGVIHMHRCLQAGVV